MLHIFNTCVQVIAKFAMAFVDPNANKDIKKANKIIARNYINRAIAKPTVGSDKESILNRITPLMENYIVMTTNYTANDAMANAHAMAVSESRKQKVKILLTSIAVLTISSIYTISVIRVMMMIVLTMTCIYYKRYELAVSINSIIISTTWSSKIISLIEIILEYYNMRTKLIEYCKLILSVVSVLI